MAIGAPLEKGHLNGRIIYIWDIFRLAMFVYQRIIWDIVDINGISPTLGRFTKYLQVNCLVFPTAYHPQVV